MKFSESKTKIIATIGPASAPKEVLKKMFLNGVDVCRLNFSHGNYEDHLQAIKIIRELNKELDIHVAILADLQGPKIRIGEVEKNTELIDGKEFILTTHECTGNSEKAYLSYKEFPKDVEKGDFILIDDGKLKLEVKDSNNKDKVVAKVISGGPLSSRKGVNLPNTKISLPSLTEKDKKDAIFALQHNVDWIALSFVRYATDILELKDIIKKHKKKTFVIAKIEKPEALKEIDNIIDLADGIMVARGDLGVEVDFYQVPLIQKEIVNKCILAAKPVVIATQMMESMITNFRPSRAEATDVANAVIDGADTVMLSGETSVGKYPVEVIKCMHDIIQYTEEKAYKYNRGKAPSEFNTTFLANSICFNASMLATQSKASAIIIFSHSGYSAYQVAGYRPDAKIFAFTDNIELLSKLSLLWATKALKFNFDKSIDEAIQYSIDILKNRHEIKHGDIVIHVGSTPLFKRERVNMLKITYVN
ncbi:pyruvate kinase [Bacteroidota bacterium]